MKNSSKKINIGIGFVTGRKNFKSVLTSYVRSFSENDFLNSKKYALHLFVAYDLKYTSTQISDYQVTDEQILGAIDTIYYLGPIAVANEAKSLIAEKVITTKESKLIFGEGYAMKRNAVLYFAIKNKMDSLIFLDDDEYPLAAIKLENGIAWRGQEILSTHMKNLQNADITNGYHCGYISPIPRLHFNETLSEAEFRIFIESISNDIINWPSIKEKMQEGGITYADPKIMDSQPVQPVESVNGMKFISGANLALNLKNPSKLFPFYNPPGARGEDTFLSTCITDCTVLKVPCYTFHDGFSAYGQLLSGVLPSSLRVMDADSPAISKRFLHASIGWIRYKPLLLYITQPDNYEKQMIQIEEGLRTVLPKICLYFGIHDFQTILKEFLYYREHVTEHFEDFENTKKAWKKIMLSSKK
ncbi:MAG: hypothetical protein RSB37_02150 [Acetivibrio sp.]